MVAKVEAEDLNQEEEDNGGDFKLPNAWRVDQASSSV
jgi:hypothetical protein